MKTAALLRGRGWVKLLCVQRSFEGWDRDDRHERTRLGAGGSQGAGLVVRLLRHWRAAPRDCSYLPAERALLEYRMMLDVTPEGLDQLLARGWRRFGPAYFRPACPDCVACVPLRVPVQSFRPSRSQRRAWNRARRLRVVIGPPRIDEERLELYRRWHADRVAARDWGAEAIDADSYFQQFAFPHPCAREFAYFDSTEAKEDRLVAVSIVDETPLAFSAVYTFYDPSLRRDSLGTASILCQHSVAQEAGKKWIYLGYRVLGCASSAYKQSFRPHELLAGWPALEIEPVWVASGMASE